MTTSGPHGSMGRRPAATRDPVRYRVVRPLGAGDAAEVFEAIREPDGLEVAVKKLLVGADGPELDPARFHDEVRVTSALDHPNLVHLFDWGFVDDRPFLVLELVRGLDLRSAEASARVMGQVLSVDLALAIAHAVALGLAHAHAATDELGRPLGLVHRDLAPDNVLLSWDGEVKLSDFGIAWAEGRAARTKVGVTRGRAELLAPEQMLGLPVDARTDVFALGCLLHWMLTGATPIEDERARAALLEGTPLTFDPSLPGDVRRALARALDPRPAARFGDAGAMAEALRSVLRARKLGDPRVLLRAWLAPLRTAPAVETTTTSRGAIPIPTVLTGSFPAALGPKTDLDAETPPSSETDPDLLPRSGSVRAIPDPAELAEPAEQAPPPDPVALLGTVLHGFRIDELLAKGGSAYVYAASHLHLPRRYAVKVLISGLEAREENVARFRREARVLSRLQHRNIVAVHDFGETADGLPFLATELLEGRSLREVVAEEGPLTPVRAAAITAQLASALSAAHAEGLVHRDLKPANVMITPGASERATIVDFGIARDTSGQNLTRALTQSGVMLGTPAYMAPEQITGTSAVGPPADVYALGAVLFFMLSGAPPFGKDTMTAIDGHLRRPPPKLPAAAGLETLTAALLAKTPTSRPTAAEVERILTQRRAPAEPDPRPLSPTRAEPDTQPATPTRAEPDTRPDGPRLQTDPRTRRLARGDALPHVGAPLATLIVLTLIAAGVVLVEWYRARTGASTGVSAVSRAEGEGTGRDALDATSAVTDGTAPTAVRVTASAREDAAVTAPEGATRDGGGAPEERRRDAAAAVPDRSAKDRGAARDGSAAKGAKTSKPEATATRTAQVDALDAGLRSALRARGLERLEELELDGEAAQAREAWGRRTADVAEVERLQASLRAAIERAILDDRYLLRRVTRLPSRIAARPAEEQRALEERYLELRGAIRPGLGAEEVRAILVRLRALEAAL